MTGQVKEEILTRFGELGLRVSEGAVSFEPALLRSTEFTSSTLPFRYLDVNDQWDELTVPEAGLAFTWCQMPFVYRLDDTQSPSLTLHLASGERQTQPMLSLPAELAVNLFQRNGQIRLIEVVLNSPMLFPT